jgi:hypothetical protein
MYILKHTPKFFFKSLSAYSSTSIVRFIFEQQVKYFSIYLPKIPPQSSTTTQSCTILPKTSTKEAQGDVNIFIPI